MKKQVFAALGIIVLVCAALITVRNAPTHALAATAVTPVVGIVHTADNGGYWIATQDGAVYSFGDATYHGGANQSKLNGAIVGLAATTDSGGYWEVGSDGGIFSFGDAIFYGSMGGQHLNAPITGMVATSTGHGYWLVGVDGGIFSFGDARFYGSMGGQHLNASMVDLTATSDNGGYWTVGADGGTFAFGTAHYYGNVQVTSPPSTAQALAQQILANARIDKSGRDVLVDLQDAAAGKVATAGHPLSATLLHLIVVLGQNHSLHITALESGGTGHCKNKPINLCPDDPHYTGDAVDIDRLDSQSVTGRNAPSLTIINTLMNLMPNGSGFGQSTCGKTPPLPAGITTFYDSCDHLHIQVPQTSP